MPRILVADDNSNIQKMVSLALHDAGIEVISVSNGGAAIRSLIDTSPDLVLADIFMPVRSGYEVCEFIKREPRFSHVPVVLLVGAFDPLDESEAQRVSADGILKKPFIPPDPLINLVKALLAKSLHERPQPAAVPVHVGVAADRECAGETAREAGEAATAESSEPMTDEFAPAVAAPDFGGHEGTLAFGSLLEIPAPSEAAEAAPSAAVPTAWDKSAATEEFTLAPSVQDLPWAKTIQQPEQTTEDDNSETLSASREHEFAGSEVPELDDVVPPHLVYGQSRGSHPAENAGDSAVSELDCESGSEPASVQSSEADLDFSSDMRAALEANGEEAEPEQVAELAPLEPRPWENSAAAPVTTARPPTAEAAAEPQDSGISELSQPVSPEAVRVEPAADELHVAADGSAEGSAAWQGPVTPVFPGSEKLWASPPEIHSETTEVPEEAKQEISETRAESEARVEEAAASPAAFELAEIDPPAFESHAFEEPGIAEQIAATVSAATLSEFVTPAAEFETGAESEAESTSGRTPFVKPNEPGGPSPAAAQTLDLELIEAVVTRIVDRMQPKVVDVVTREILRPLVEALVRREINKNS